MNSSMHVNIDVDIPNESNEDYIKEYDILLGEWEAGNNNNAIRNKLKVYINDFVRQKRITLSEGLTMIESLN